MQCSLSTIPLHQRSLASWLHLAGVALMAGVITGGVHVKVAAGVKRVVDKGVAATPSVDSGAAVTLMLA